MDALKRCSKCGEKKLATTEYFHRHTPSAGGLRSECKECRARQGNAIFYAKNAEKRALSVQGLRRCTKCGTTKPATLEHFSKRSSSREGLAAECRECGRLRCEIHQRARGVKPAKRLIIQNRMLRCATCGVEKLATLEYFYGSRTTSIGLDPRCKECINKYNRRNPQHLISSTLRRRARKRNLPNTWTAQDWNRCLEYFNHCCAVCGRQLRSLFGTHTAAADHWIPLTDKRPDNPGTVPINIVPLCHGEGGCNNIKSDKPPEIWIIETYGTRKAKAIMQRVQDYFNWIKQQTA